MTATITTPDQFRERREVRNLEAAVKERRNASPDPVHVAFPKPDGGYEAVKIEPRPWWEFPGMRAVVIVSIGFGLLVAAIQFGSAQ